MTDTVLGAVLAGGLSVRYGSPKALATVGGVRVVDRAAAALRAALADEDVVAIVNDAGLARQIGLPYRADVLRGVGPVAGVHAALGWASERGARGVLVVGCDMPFVEPELLRELRRRSHDADVVIPASAGPRGVEPLCAFYAVACMAAIERAAARGDGRMIGFHGDVSVAAVPVQDLLRFGDPGRMFFNVNTPADRAEAERLYGESGT
jgi:molybdopterin-guanine dinucleotide biosynthesis protein A